MLLQYSAFMIYCISEVFCIGSAPTCMADVEVLPCIAYVRFSPDLYSKCCCINYFCYHRTWWNFLAWVWSSTFRRETCAKKWKPMSLAANTGNLCYQSCLRFELMVFASVSLLLCNKAEPWSELCIDSILLLSLLFAAQNPIWGTYSCGSTTVFGWVGVYISFLIDCRIPSHTKGTRTRKRR